METNIRLLNQRLGDAKQNGGRVADTFREMGLSLDELLKASPEEKLLMIADGMGTVETYAEKSAIATEIFGRSGMKMLNLLGDAKNSFARARDEIGRFGNALNLVDSANIEKTQDNITEVSLAMKGLATQLTAGFAPAINKVAEFLGNVLGKYAETLKKARELKGVVTGLADEEERYSDEQINAFTLEFLNLAKKKAQLEEVASKEGLVSDKVRERIPEIEKEMNRIRQVIDLEIERRKVMEEPLPTTPSHVNIVTEESGGAITPTSSPEAQAEFYNTKLAMLQESMMTEDELLKSQLEEQRAIVEEAYLNEELSAEEHNDLMLAIDKNYLDKLEKNHKGAMNAIQKFQAMSWHQQTATVAGELAGLTQTLDSTNKDQFKIVKAGAIAQAIVNTYQGISKSLANYPWPLAGVMAAAHATAGFLQVDNIRKQTFGGGGSYSAPPAPTSVPADVAGDGTGGGSGTMVTINLQGQTYQKQDVADLIAQINEAVGDGSKIRVG
jgi:hypothetical protein